jgi:TPR repeat protein
VTRRKKSGSRSHPDSASSVSDLGQAYYWGSGRRRSYVKAFPLLLEAAQAGDAECQNLVGYSYEHGLGTPKDLSEAIHWYGASAVQGHPDGSFNLALAYDFGTGVRRNARKAFSLYVLAAGSGSVKAQNNLGIAYLIGEGVKQNVPMAFHWLRRAAQKDVKAQYSLGRLYLYQLNKPCIARRWLQRAADSGHRDATRLLNRLRRDAISLAPA